MTDATETQDGTTSLMARAYKTRIYPSPEQARILTSWANALRGVHNVTIRDGYTAWVNAQIDHAEEGRWDDDGGSPGPHVFRNEKVKVKTWSLWEWTRKGPAWMGRPPASFRNHAQRCFDRAWQGWRRTGHRPTTHKKRGRLSLGGQNIRFVSDDRIQLPLPKSLTAEERVAMSEAIRLAEPMGARLRAGRPGRGPRTFGQRKSPARAPGWKGANGDVAVISRVGGLWYASFPADEHHPPAPRDEQLLARGVVRRDAVGVDVNTGTFVCSDGTRYEVPESLRRLESLIEDAHRGIARCTKGSKRREHAKQLLERRYAKQARIRRDWLDKITYELATRCKVVVVEDLKIKQMTRSGPDCSPESPWPTARLKATLNRRILNAAFGMFRELLTRKSKWYGSVVVAVAPHHTSLDCSECGVRKQPPPGRKRVRYRKVFICDACGFRQDNDLNAAINIVNRFKSDVQSTGTMEPGGSGIQGGTRKGRDAKQRRGYERNASGAQLPPSNEQPKKEQSREQNTRNTGDRSREMVRADSGGAKGTQDDAEAPCV